MTRSVPLISAACLLLASLPACSASQAEDPETESWGPAADSWDGVTKSETDAIVTLNLPSEPAKILLNGTAAKAVLDRKAGTARVLIEGTPEGTSCENDFVVTFKDGTRGELAANHCHGDTVFDIVPGKTLDRRLTKSDVDNPDDDPLPVDPPPGEALSFEWSANGFEQLPADFAWSGGGGANAFLMLSVPETDNFVWISECADGVITSYIQLHSDSHRIGGSTVFKMETDKSRTFSYPVDIVALPFGDGGDNSPSPRLLQAPGDPVFNAMRKDSWIYMQMGEGDDAIKIRTSLKGAGKALDAFLPACQ